jgi:sensor histidine kinase regulating citrate/malate metabolism
MIPKEGDKAASVRAYLQEYADQVEEVAAAPVCENAVADALCRRYRALAAKDNIHTDVAVSLPFKTGVADADLAVLLGNLWENALEACRRQTDGEKTIRLRAQLSGNSMMISIINSFSGELRVREQSIAEKDGELVLFSLKRGEEKEGVGLASIRAIVKRYGGLDEVTYDANRFNVKVLLYS